MEAAAERKAVAAYGGDVSPAEAWNELSRSANAQLIDVRTQAEWSFAGVPTLEALDKNVRTISWKFYPNFELNPRFIEQLEAAVPDKTAPLFFVCKTGGRSTDAAIAATAAGYTHAYNVAGGFEGDINQNHQRGQVNGWKAAKLPWHQA